MTAPAFQFDAAVRASLEQGLEQLPLAEDPHRIAALERFVGQLLHWNTKTNLTAITDPAEIVVKHLLDCLAAMPAGLSGRACDIGSGAGLPGLLWARENPEVAFDSIESRRRKSAFQQQMAIVWSLNNFRAIESRVEQVNGAYDWLCFRAFAPLERALPQIEHLLAAGGTILAMKGPGVGAELDALDSNRWRYTMTPLFVPGLTAERCLVQLRRVADAASN